MFPGNHEDLVNALIDRLEDAPPTNQVVKVELLEERSTALGNQGVQVASRPLSQAPEVLVAPQGGGWPQENYFHLPAVFAWIGSASFIPALLRAIAHLHLECGARICLKGEQGSREDISLFHGKIEGVYIPLEGAVSRTGKKS